VEELGVASSRITVLLVQSVFQMCLHMLFSHGGQLMSEGLHRGAPVVALL